MADFAQTDALESERADAGDRYSWPNPAIMCACIILSLPRQGLHFSAFHFEGVVCKHTL